MVIFSCVIVYSLWRHKNNLNGCARADNDVFLIVHDNSIWQRKKSCKHWNMLTAWVMFLSSCVHWLSFVTNMYQFPIVSSFFVNWPSNNLNTAVLTCLNGCKILQPCLCLLKTNKRIFLVSPYESISQHVFYRDIPLSWLGSCPDETKSVITISAETSF